MGDPKFELGKQSPMDRYRQLDPRAKYETAAAYWSEKLSLKAQELESRRDAAQQAGDQTGIKKAQRELSAAMGNLNKQFAKEVAFRDLRVPQGGDLITALKQKLASKEQEVKAFKGSVEDGEALDAEVEGLGSAIQDVEEARMSYLDTNTPFAEWLPSWFEKGYLVEGQKKPETPPQALPVRNQAERAAHSSAAHADANHAEKLRTKLEREAVIEQVMTNGAFAVHTSLVNKKDGVFAGFQDLLDPPDPRWKPVLKGIVGEGWRRSKVLFGGGRNGVDVDRELVSRGIAEQVTLDPLLETKSRVEEAVVDSGGLAGFFGMKKKEQKQVSYTEPVVDLSAKLPGHPSHEPGCILSYRTAHSYTDYSGRDGNLLDVRMVLPLSVAKKVLEMAKKDPSIIRDVVKKACIEKTGVVTEEMWNLGSGNGNRGGSMLTAKEIADCSIRPPYEQWKAEMGGVERMLIQDRVGKGQDGLLFNQADVFTFPQP